MEDHESTMSSWKQVVAKVDTAIAKINEKFDEIIDCNQKAKSDLYINTPTLQAFYEYYGIMIVGEPDPSIFISKITEKVEHFNCDFMEYYQDMRTRFIRLLRHHNDKQLSLVACVLTSMENSMKDQGEDE